MSDKGRRTAKLPSDLLRQLVLGRRGAPRPETLVHAAIGVDTLHLIASGAQLIARPDGPAMVAGLATVRVAATNIGVVTPHGRELLRPDGAVTSVETLDCAELYRLLEGR